MLQLNNLSKITKARKRVGRGGDSGGTSGKGHKGQRARTGGSSKIRVSFEGGQMPLSRRIPQRGFTNAFAKETAIIKVSDLESRFESGDIVNETSLREKGLVSGHKRFKIKVLGNGSLTKSLVVQVHAFSKSADTAIKKAGGDTRLIEESGSGSVAS